MLLIHCPYYKELRDEEEFHYAGEAYIVRPQAPEDSTEDHWGDYVFMRTNGKGWIWEQWTHGAGCRKTFAAKRNNVTNEFAGTWTLEEAKPMFLQDKQDTQHVQNAAAKTQGGPV